MEAEMSRRGRVKWLWALLALALSAGAGIVALYAGRHHVPVHWQVAVRALISGVTVDHGVRIAMPDGVHLAASLYLPPNARRSLPTVLIRLPYDRKRYGEALASALFFSRHGYAVLVQDIRGKFESEGEFAPWYRATEDGAATLDWIVQQPWSNGKVGTFGCSALGELQYALARARHPAHAAMIAQGAGGALGSMRGTSAHFGFFEGGVFQLASGFGWFVKHGAKDPRAPAPAGLDIGSAIWGLPVAGLVNQARPAPNAYDELLRWPLDDPRWRGYGFVSDGDRLTTPTLDINNWGDQTIEGTLALARHARAQETDRGPVRHHVVIAPGDHCEAEAIAQTGRFGDLEMPHAEQPYRDWYLRWFDHWLRGNADALEELPPYLFYVVGEGRWLTSSHWPPEGVQTQRWYLHSAGRANSRDGDGQLLTAPAPAGEANDEFVYDPAKPVPSRGGPLCCTGNPADRAGPVDQRDVETRSDVLVYTSPPLQRPLRIAGPLVAKLTVSSSAPDTDFVARLVHVWPDGRATSIQEGALRARYREGTDKPALMTPGQTYQIAVNMRSIAYLLPEGHRLRLHVTSSSFPRLERNLNTGGDNAEESRGVVARNRVHHGGARLSYLELPVLELPAVGSDR
ncbi:CocE/NonD family hydrolase [Schlegelella sp. S2-27]|uniref:CocE/NonD family hydrolase n=1 Tax=Caldimonas mangrovi TaxID=2944811 RepID=A0ABT0YQ17_9BURK|nr:CocE/NonD family hydrolase [Caldimonas mangrovi]MCM5680342.1 CocE/NonD family hydrolase [Caldimonas mangrovi]